MQQETKQKKLVELSIEELLAELRKLYDQRRALHDQIEEAAKPFKDEFEEVDKDIRTYEELAQDIAERSDLDELMHSDVAVTKREGRRTITAKPNEIPEDLREHVTKVKVQMITLAEYDRLIKDRQDLDATHLENVLGIIRKATWEIKDLGWLGE